MASLESISKYVLVPALLLYFAGWIYLYFFFFYLGVGVSILDLDIYTVLSYSVSVLIFIMFSWVTWLAVGLFVIVFIAGLTSKKMGSVLRRFFSRTKKIVTGSMVTQAVLCLLFLLGSFYVARAAGIAHTLEVKTIPGPTIMIQFSKELAEEKAEPCRAIDGCYYDLLVGANSGAALREVLETKEYLVV